MEKKTEVKEKGLVANMSKALAVLMRLLLPNSTTTPIGYKKPIKLEQENENPISRLIYYAIYPYGYGGFSGKKQGTLKDMIDRAIAGASNGKHSFLVEQNGFGLIVKKKRLDAFAVYLGLPQRYSTFRKSAFKPKKSSEETEYLAINDFWQNLLPYDTNYNGIIYTVSEFAKYVGYQDTVDGRLKEPGVDSKNFIMGNFSFELGEDEKGKYISYYDEWNLGSSKIEGEKGLIGSPFEVYDRLYYVEGKSSEFDKGEKDYDDIVDD